MSWLPPIGHDAALTMLRNAAARGRLGQAYLFVGPAGVGKRRVARHLALALLCENSTAQTLTPCGHCAACVQVAALSHPDYFEVAKPADKNQLPIESIHELCRNLALRPARGSRKIAIVDDVDLLNEEAANCFLKTLEEPPKGSLLILVGGSAETQLATIVSRCQVIAFQPLAETQVAKVLLQLDATTDPAEAARLAAWSGGSVARALQLAEGDWAAIRSQLARDLSATPIDSIALTAAATAFIDAAGKEAALKRIRARQVIGLTVELFRKALLAAAEMQLGDTDFDRAAAQIATRLSAQQLLDSLERCMLADFHLGRFLTQQLAVDCWLDDLAQIAAGAYELPFAGALPR